MPLRLNEERMPRIERFAALAPSGCLSLDRLQNPFADCDIVMDLKISNACPNEVETQRRKKAN